MAVWMRNLMFEELILYHADCVIGCVNYTITARYRILHLNEQTPCAFCVVIHLDSMIVCVCVWKLGVGWVLPSLGNPV